MTIAEKINNMSDKEVKSIWDSFKGLYWSGETMYDENTTMDEWAMMIYSEMDYRNLDKGL